MLDVVRRIAALIRVEKRMKSELEGVRVFCARGDGTGFVSSLSSQAQSLADW